MTVCIEIEMENAIIIPTDKTGRMERKILLRENSEDEGSEYIRRD
jgi:hypothetical protein